MHPIRDPRVLYAIQRACEKRARKKARLVVATALERAGAASLAWLAADTGLDMPACGAALDALRVRGLAVEEPAGTFCWVNGQ